MADECKKWTIPIRVVAVVAALAMAGLLLMLAGKANPETSLAGMLWWPAWPMVVLAVILGTVRMASATFVAACLLATGLALSMASLDYGSTTRLDLETAWGLTNLLTWLGLLVVGGVAFLEFFVRIVLRSRRGPGRPDPGR